MQISNLKTLAIPSLNDVLPILDINGGASGKPILRKATLSSLFALIEPSVSGFTVPTVIKTVADAGDYFIGIDSTGTPYKITKADLFAGLSSGGGGGDTLPGGGGDTSPDHELTFTNPGDDQGLFYYLGTLKGAASWSNPNGNLLIVTASSNGSGIPASLVNRFDDEFYTNSENNSWVKFQIESGKFKCNYYSIRARNRSDHYPRNWKLQASNNGIDWDDLDTQINNTTIQSPSQWLALPVVSSTSFYSKFRLLQNGINSSGTYFFCLGEVEFNGFYQAPISTGGTSVSYPSGMALLLDGGSLNDKSGNNRNAVPIGELAPITATGIDEKEILRWNGTGTQELAVVPFLSGTTGATLYCVCSINSANNYNLIRTAALDDYWKFISGGGYFGAFRNSRFEGYPSSMPSSGNHLISIHTSQTTYEIVVDAISKGVQPSGYTPGDRFRIVTNDKTFAGDIALLLVYPQYTMPGSTSDLGVRDKIKLAYPSLPFEN